MIKKISDSEISLVESMVNDIQKRIHTYYMENVISKEYVKAEVLVPMSENVNMSFEIDVPYEFMDEDNTALLEYFVGHIYQPESGSYMTESINESIAKKERNLQKFQENLDNFDVDAFERGDYDKYFAEHGEEPEEYFESRALFEMAGRIPGEAKIPGKPKKQGLIIAMGSDERNIHHFHVFWNETDRERWKNGACLYLDDNRYYDHKDNTETLSKDELQAVVEKLKEHYPNKRFHGTNWEFLVELWNANNHRYPVDPNLQMPEYNYKTIIRYNQKSTLYEDYDILDTPIDDDDECYTEMATVARDENRQMRIQINPDRDRVGNPYFKVFNTVSPQKRVSHVARFHFNDQDMEYHNDKFLDWVIDKNDIKQIKSFLMESHYMSPQYTNWQMACYLWNYEYGFIGSRDKYFKGEDDVKNKDHPSYVKHDQEMPEAWVYNPSKGKNKRK